MGQCYSAYADFKIDDEDKFLEAFRDAMSKVNARWDMKPEDLNDADEAIQMLIPRGRYDTDGDNHHAESDFDASYGWETVMSDVFENVASTLGNGSFLEVFPDSGGWRLDVIDGEIVD